MTDWPLPGWELVHRGPDREEFAARDRVLVMMDERLTIDGRVLAGPVPGRSEVRARLSAYWFQRMDFVPHNFITADVAAFPAELRARLEARAEGCWLAHRVPALPVGGWVQGYLSGAAWQEYSAEGTVGGHELPRGLREASRLPEPVFMARETTVTGEKCLVRWEKCRQLLGDEMAHAVRQASLEVYDYARVHAERAGVIVAATQFEFGLSDDTLMLIGELLTPDVSLFWSAADWAPGSLPPRWERQAAEEWLRQEGGGHGVLSPPPEVLHRTAEAYREIYQRLALGRPSA